MPPWTSRRLLSPNSRSESGPAAAGTNSSTGTSHSHSSTTTRSGLGERELRETGAGLGLGLELGYSANNVNARSRLTESDILEHAYGIPSLPQHTQIQHGASATAKDKLSSRATSQGHGRSMSHPFPSLFSGKKKGRNHHQDGETGGGVGGGGALFDSTDDDSSSPFKPKVADKDLRTGKCMTCDSMVRWPKELKVFRCTVCLTINDLKAVVLEVRDGQRVPPVKSGTGGAGGFFGQSAPSVKVNTLSVDKTKQLIDSCVTMYLLERMKEADGHTSSPMNSPQQSPELNYQASVDGTLKPPRSSEFLLPSPTKYLRRPVGNASESAASRPGIPIRHEDGKSRIIPYSSSSPGTFGAHMEQRGREIQMRQTRQQTSRTSGYHEEDPVERERQNAAGSAFKPLEEYIVSSFGSYEGINASFSTARPALVPRAASEGSSKHMASRQISSRQARAEAQLSEMDAKTLLIGDNAENGYWWTGERSDGKNSDKSRTHRGDAMREAIDAVTLKSPRIDWSELSEWYYIVINAGRGWRKKLDDFALMEYHAVPHRLTDQEMEDIEEQFMEGQSRIQRVLLKATESLLKRPSRPLNEPSDLRFLLIILANPLLYPLQPPVRHGERGSSRSKSRDIRPSMRSPSSEAVRRGNIPTSPHPPNANRGSSGQHSGIIKRILGLLSNVPNESHHHLVSWLARYSDSQFQKITDLIGSFVTYRLTRQHGKKREVEHDLTAGLIPHMGGRGESTPAALHAALGAGSTPQSSKKGDSKPKPVVYNDDWQIKAAARVMSLVFAANNSGMIRRGDRGFVGASEAGHSAGLAARERAQRHGQILATSDFYNTLLDYSDLIADFEAWESRRGKFSFCQYPFFLSIWAKIQIMEHDARRQMEVKAREAFFDSIMTRKNVNQYLVLKIRRECLVEDSLKGVSEVVGGGGEEIKKGLRIEFKGEEGIDAGGLRKEWFLLLVRDVFNPEHGMFVYDDDSQFCYFNPNSFETTDQFFLVGVVLGLAIYNSTILDVAFPPFAFRKLLAAAPAAAPGATSHAKPSMTYSLEDLAEFRPSLANGLRQLLEFDGDVESVFCRDFVADVDKYGEIVQVPLCPGGEKRPVTNSNRREFVDLYVKYLLDIAVIRQFEPFKRGFFTVCGGNALSLFRAEEIELLIRGSEEPLDIDSLRAVSRCENWGVPNATETEPVIQWFWRSFQTADPKDQRKLLSFITGSDRIPAMGTTNLVIKLSCLGDDSPRFPVARTCFNQISLWRYSSRAKLEKMLWWAVHESEGFGLK